MEVTNLGQFVDALKYKPGGFEDWVLTFGKYKNKKVSEIPDYYKFWALRESRKNIQYPPSYVTCGECQEKFNSEELPEENITGIHSEEYFGSRYGADCLEFKCPKCGKNTDSIIRIE